MLSWFLFAAALAAPTGWNVTKTNADDGNCELSLGPAMSDGVVPMRAECVWKDVTLDGFKAVAGAWESHDEVFTAVVASKIERTDGAKSLVHQEHQSSGIANREVMIWMEHTTVDGYERYGWNSAKDEPLTLTSGNVAATRDTGYWQAKAEPSGGIRVVHLLEYDPGGSVPGFLVRWFQTSGLTANVVDMHTALKGK